MGAVVVAKGAMWFGCFGGSFESDEHQKYDRWRMTTITS